jgi:hypothetical protein
VPADAAVHLRLVPDGEELPRRNAQLPLDEVDARDHLGHRVLHLEAGVHLHEVELGVRVVRVEHELDGACEEGEVVCGGVVRGECRDLWTRGLFISHAPAPT